MGPSQVRGSRRSESAGSASSDQGIMSTMNESGSPAMGHRVLPHTADLIIEAWGPSRVVCLEEAARALVDSFASIEGVPVTERVPIQLEQGGDEALLVSLLEEIIYVVDVLGGIPTRVTLEETEDGGISGFIDIAPADVLEIHGSLPKGVSFTDLAFARSDGSWRCHATIDV
jgi:SHS2 domain-containing protein